MDGSSPGGSATLDRFVRAVEAGDDEATEAAALALAPADMAALAPLARSATGDLRWWAVRGLAACARSEAAGEERGTLPAAVAAVASALQADDPSLRAAAALALGHIGSAFPEEVEPALAELARLLEDPDGFVRQAAVDGFALCGDTAVPTLAAVLFHSQHQAARSRAAAALRHIRTMKAAPVLYRLLNDPNLLVHSYALEALDEMGLLETLLLKP